MKRGGSTLGDPGPLLLLRQARRGRPTEKLLRLPAVRLQEGRTTSLRLGPPSGGGSQEPRTVPAPWGGGGGGQDQRAVGSLPAPRQAPATSEAAVSALGGVARSRGGRGVGGVEHPALAQREVTFLDRTRTAAPLQQLPAARPLGLAPSLAKLEDTSHSVAQGCGVATTP